MPPITTRLAVEWSRFHAALAAPKDKGDGASSVVDLSSMSGRAGCRRLGIGEFLL